MTIEWRDCKYHDDMQEILDMATGADGGITFINVCAFLIKCEEQGNEPMFMQQFAELCRMLKERVSR